MRRARPLGKFRKDLKRVSKRGWDVSKLNYIIVLLQTSESLPPTARPHKLSGQYEGLWECHIESDWILIYKAYEKEIFLARTGTHADLFE